MPEAVAQKASPPPLIALSEDEVLFRDNIRQFADERITPLVREMDEKGVFDHHLLEEFFQLGIMGIEIPEQYGGGAGTFFEAILAVEEISRVDASAGVVVDVQNTLVANALLRWGNPEQKNKYLARMAKDTVGAYALSGLCSALAGLVYTLYTSSGNATAATGLELDAIAAVVIGGTTLSGGTGSVGGTVIGILIIAAAAVILALGLAYLPMRILVTQIAKKVAEPIRDFIQRQRDRRALARDTPDRRKA